MKVSVIILTQNNQDFIAKCLESVSGWAKEIVVVDAGSTDKTLEIAKKFGCRIFNQPWLGFSRQRTLGAQKVLNDWMFYLDADERMTEELKQEINHLSASSPEAGFQVKRKNFILGKWLKKGGWYPDWQTRLINKTKFKKWVGRIHEYPQLTGETGRLNQPFIHLTHRGINWNLRKTIDYTDHVAELMAEAHTFRCRWWHSLTAPMRQFWQRGIAKGGLFEGMEGFITVLYQTFDTFITYAKLWEKQQSESMAKKYQKLDGR
ncbi:MAG: glycosyltransferase family 2 protein [Candidatus Beckwithbacteria bacterium]|nr:glycosyltransferase family 2 protein [Candidatus Beckwithbacteria bacterium]